MIHTARDWLLKRLLAYTLQRSLGRYLHPTAFDLARQLDVTAGVLQLHAVELDVDVLNADLVSVG
eukprot:364040-Chlamydomonas_euryale.AAC.12